jgi:hypothetical protein
MASTELRAIMTLSVDQVNKIIQENFGLQETAAKEWHAVKRLDNDETYQLLQFHDQSSDHFIAAIIGNDGALKSSVKMQQGLTLDEPELLKHYRASGAEVIRVWQPSKISASPYYPFWKIIQEGRQFYMDSKGFVVDEIKHGRA